MKRWFCILFYSGSLLADVQYETIVDRYFSPYIGAEDIISAQYSLEYLQDNVIQFHKDTKKNFWSGMGRFAELFLFWDPIDAVGVTTQHEVFGHGFRIRSLHSQGAKVRGYKIDLPSPYGDGGGETRFSERESQTTAFEELSVVSGGVEATAILANRLALKWFQRGYIDARETMLYFDAQQDLTVYSMLSKNEDGGDVSHYVHLLNKTYDKSHIKVKTLRQRALVGLLDPLTYYSVYAWWRFVVCGKSTHIPMISIRSYKYLPSIRLGLTPFGPEYYLDNYLVKDRKPICFYFRAGNYSHQNYIGAGVEHAYLWNIQSLPWGLRLDLWYQPHTAFRDLDYSLKKLKIEHDFHQQPHNPRAGIALSIIGQIKMSSHTAAYFQLGGKTIGFLPGEPLQPSIIARLGMSFR